MRLILMALKLRTCRSNSMFCLALITSIGCNLHKPRLTQPMAGEPVKIPLGKIGIVAAQRDPELYVRVPAKGALHGMIEGATHGAQIGSEVTQEYLKIAAGTDLCKPSGQRGCGQANLFALIQALVFRVLGPPIGGATGVVIGGFAAENKRSVESSEQAIHQVLVRLKIQENMRDKVVWVVAQETPYEAGPAESVGPFPSAGYNSLLRIRVSEIGLMGDERSVNPPLQLFVRVKTELMRGADGSFLDERSVFKASEAIKFTEWGANNAEMFAHVLEGLYLSLAEQIVDELLQYPPATIEAAEEVLANDPDHRGARTGRGIARVKLGKYEAALDDLRRIASLGPLLPRVYAVSALAKKNLGDFQGSLQDYDAAIGSSITSAPSRLYTERADVKVKLKQLDGALSDYNEALRLEPDSAELYVNRAALHIDRGDTDSALQDYSMAKSIDPDSAQAYYEIIRLYEKRGNHLDAYRDYNHSLQLNPDYPEPKDLERLSSQI